jgi:hypothetical protein
MGKFKTNSGSRQADHLKKQIKKWRQEHHSATAEKTGSILKIHKSRNKIQKNNKMKNLLILATMLLTFGFANAQSKLYSTNEYGSSSRQVGKFENGKIYSTNEYGSSARQIGKIENGKIYSTNEYGSSARQIGKIENDKIYSTNEYGSSARQVGKIEGGKVYSTNEYGSSARQVGKYDGGSSSGAAAAFILIL